MTSETTPEERLLEATVGEMQRALDDPDTNPADHALHNSGRIGENVDGSVGVKLHLVDHLDLDPVPGSLPRPDEHEQWTGGDGRIHGRTTIDLTRPNTVQMKFTCRASATLSLQEEDRSWTERRLSPEQQRTLDRYATEAAFWLTGSANGSLAYTGENPADYRHNEETRESIITEQLHEDVRWALGEQAAACLLLARRTGVDGQPDAAFQDAALAIRAAAAKAARANYEPGLGEARTFHRRLAETERAGAAAEPAERSSRVYLELEEDTTPASVRRALDDAGIRTRGCRTVAGGSEGYIMTGELMSEIWSVETGDGTCRGECAGGQRQHRAWEDLDSEQREAFVGGFVRFIEECREDAMIAADLLEEETEFAEILTSPHPPEGVKRPE